MSLNRNTAANLVGRLWMTLLSIALIPLYMRFLGIEAYALVGVFGTLQVVLSLLDLGMGAAFSREIARLSSQPSSEQRQRDLLATFTVIYWTLAAIIAIVVWLAAPFVAEDWVKPATLSVGSVTMALRLMGIAIAAQMPIGFYQGGLLGLQRQVTYNTLLMVTNTIRGLGAVSILAFVAPTVEAFFGWQALLVVAAAIVNALVLDRAIPRAERSGAFSVAIVKDSWRYAAGWAGNTLGIALAQQSDKVILSKLLPLEQFGYYTLAGNVAALLWTLVASVTAAAFPRFNQQVARGDEQALAAEYHRANDLLATFVVPISGVVLFFPREVMTLWTRDPAVAAATERLLVPFALGMTLIGLVNAALHVALAYGWFRLSLGFTWGTALLAVPAFWFAARSYGAIGAAVVWMLQNAAYLFLVPLLHRRHLPGELRRWLVLTLLVPGALVASVCLLARMIIPTEIHPFVLALSLGVTWLVAAVAVGLAEPSIRTQLASLSGRLRMGRA